MNLRQWLIDKGLLKPADREYPVVRMKWDGPVYERPPMSAEMVARLKQKLIREGVLMPRKPRIH